MYFVLVILSLVVRTTASVQLFAWEDSSPKRVEDHIHVRVRCNVKPCSLVCFGCKRLQAFNSLPQLHNSVRDGNEEMMRTAMATGSTGASAAVAAWTGRVSNDAV